MPGVSNLPGLVKRQGGVAFGARYRGTILLSGKHYMSKPNVQ